MTSSNVQAYVEEVTSLLAASGILREDELRAFHRFLVSSPTGSFVCEGGEFLSYGIEFDRDRGFWVKNLVDPSRKETHELNERLQGLFQQFFPTC